MINSTCSENSDTLFKTLIFNYCLLLVLQFVSSIVIWNDRLGWSVKSISDYYLNVSEQGSKSLFGIIEVLSPHLFSMGITFFILCHFLMFIPDLNKVSKWGLSFGLFVSLFFNLFSGPAIVFLNVHFAYVKFISFLSFQLFYFLILLTFLVKSRPFCFNQTKIL